MTTNRSTDPAELTPPAGAYEPGGVERDIYAAWETSGAFHATVDPTRKPYTIVIPPPNVTGALHLGHALNNAIQDVLIRFHRMRGDNACWIPGTDHAGIATQSVVERRLRKEDGQSRYDLGREAMIERIWKWKDAYEARIVGQLKKLGCSCDWERQAFTMSDTLSRAVRTVFVRLHTEGLIYRAQRLINWCPGCRTALSNDELVRESHAAHFWTLRYPIKGRPGEFVQVATTRPETMLGDTAVAVHPRPKEALTHKLEKARAELAKATAGNRAEREARVAALETRLQSDLKRLERYAALIGQTAILPIMDREIPIIGDDILCDPALGTGAVKVTPAHDPNDEACGRRHELPFINLLHDDGRLNENAGPYAGYDRFAARDAVVAELERLGLLAGIEDHEHELAHCYRSHDIVEPYLSDQWFVRMAPLVKLAQQASGAGGDAGTAGARKQVSFFPAAREKLYFDWLAMTPDWCISRQIWWGHRIPVWYCRACEPQMLHYDDSGRELMRVDGAATPILPAVERPTDDPTACPRCGGADLVQDPSVLDTWFSSQLWPLSTLGWPEETPDLDYFYPTNVLVTARDIIALWVARMVMMGMRYRDGVAPFAHVFITGTVLDERGDIMSKSRGNGIDPVRAIDGGEEEIHALNDLGAGATRIPKDRREHYPTYGADALRYGMISMAAVGQDIKLVINRTPRDPSEPDDATLPEYDVKIPRFEEGRRFANKLWQVAHGVVLKRTEDLTQPWNEPFPALADRWLLHRLGEGTARITAALDKYRLAEACDVLYDLAWNDFCSWYVELVKPRLWGEAGADSKRQAQTLLLRGLGTLLALAHPIMPHVTEKLTGALGARRATAGGSLPGPLIHGPWPAVADFPADPEAAAITIQAREIWRAIMRIRASQPGIGEGQRLPRVVLRGPSASTDALRPLFPGLARLAKVERIEAGHGAGAPAFGASAAVGDLEVLVDLEGVIDRDAERARLEKDIAGKRAYIERLTRQLANPGYVEKAPPDKVAETRERLATAERELAGLEASRRALP